MGPLSRRCDSIERHDAQNIVNHRGHTSLHSISSDSRSLGLRTTAAVSSCEVIWPLPRLRPTIVRFAFLNFLCTNRNGGR